MRVDHRLAWRSHHTLCVEFKLWPTRLKNIQHLNAVRKRLNAVCPVSVSRNEWEKQDVE